MGAMLSRIIWNNRLGFAVVLGALSLPLLTTGCWHERREPVVYVEPRHDDHVRHEEVRHEEHEEHRHD